VRKRTEDGVAALEMALVSSVLLLLAFGALPLFSMMHGYQKVNGASADTLRYATSVDANARVVRTNPDGTQVISRRPTRDDITRFAQGAANDPGLVITVTVYVGESTTARAPKPGIDPIEAQTGDLVTVVVKKDIDLSLLGSVANAVGNLVGAGDFAPNSIVTVSSTASAREE
jgi:Flp pilus assembly protein TadG